MDGPWQQGAVSQFMDRVHKVAALHCTVHTVLILIPSISIPSIQFCIVMLNSVLFS